jgi:hypothetical protein
MMKMMKLLGSTKIIQMLLVIVALLLSMAPQSSIVAVVVVLVRLGIVRLATKMEQTIVLFVRVRKKIKTRHHPKNKFPG